MTSTAPEAPGPPGLDSLRALLTLKAAPGLGDPGMRALLERHSSPAAALASLATWAPAAAAAARTRAVRARVDRSLRTLADAGVNVLVRGHAGYPHFEGLHDPPPLLFALGDLSLLRRPAVAVVGSRRHTEYGAEATRRIVSELSAAGVVVASGLAHGIDRIAHESALESGGGTFAVIGNGIDVEYPAANAGLQRRIARDGLVLSEFLPGEPALPHHFPKRNRLLAALTAGTVVVEAAGRSGSLITAEHALDMGREVFAVPGPIGRTTSEGTNGLIRDGACIVTTPGDILSALGIRPGAVPAAPRAALGPAGARARSVWSALEHGPLHVDDVSRKAGIDAVAALEALLELEMRGQVRQLPGMRFARAA